MQTEDGPRPVGNGKPQPNYEVALSAWQEVGAAIGTIVPMAGEIALARPGEIEAYGAAAASNGIDELHCVRDRNGRAPVRDRVHELLRRSKFHGRSASSSAR